MFGSDLPPPAIIYVMPEKEVQTLSAPPFIDTNIYSALPTSPLIPVSQTVPNPFNKSAILNVTYSYDFSRQTVQIRWTQTRTFVNAAPQTTVLINASLTVPLREHTSSRGYSTGKGSFSVQGKTFTIDLIKGDRGLRIDVKDSGNPQGSPHHTVLLSFTAPNSDD